MPISDYKFEILVLVNLGTAFNINIYCELNSSYCP